MEGGFDVRNLLSGEGQAETERKNKREKEEKKNSLLIDFEVICY